MAIEITRLFDFPYYQKQTYNLEKAFTSKSNGKWNSISTEEYINQANKISRGLIELGVKPNDKIAIISTTNRTEWNVCDIGILQIGAQNVPIYPTISENDYEYIINHSEAVFCFVSDKEIVDKINTIKDKTKLKDVFTFDAVKGERNWAEVLDLGEDTKNQNIVEDRKNKVKADDLATLIYTSGTTGKPKGVMLSHKNIVSNVLASEMRVPLLNGNDKALSFLPVCHIFERMILYLYQYCGISIYFAESIEELSNNAKEIQPNVMSAVPRLYEKIYDKIIFKGEALSGIKKALFFWAVNLGLHYKPYGENGWWYEKKLSLAQKLIFSKWQEALGGKLKIMVSGSAALQPRLNRVFAAAGMPIMEGYGLTETSPVISVNDMRNRGFKTGTVGKVIDGVTVKISEKGEILVKGPNVMLGYYKDEEKTKKVMKDGFFCTGDKGEFDNEGFLKITGRTKEMFKTSGGKYIVPPLVEGKLKQSLFIEQAMVIGEGEKMPAAIIQPNFEFIREWIKHKKYTIGNSEQEIVSSQLVVDRIKVEVEKCNTSFGKWETIKRFELTPEVWSIEAGHLTPTMKMKRAIIKEIYKDLYVKIYSN